MAPGPMSTTLQAATLVSLCYPTSAKITVAPATFAAEAQLVRILGLGQAWSGLNPNSPAEYVNSSEVFAAATKAFDWWITNDYNNTACLQYGGQAACPCGTPGLWDTNWYHQVIAIPTLASEACLMLYTGNLTDTQRAKCLDYGIRGSNFSSQPSLGIYQTASNVGSRYFLTCMRLMLSPACSCRFTVFGALLILQIMEDVINAAIYSNNATLLSEAYDVADSVFLVSLVEVQLSAVRIDRPSVCRRHGFGWDSSRWLFPATHGSTLQWGLRGGFCGCTGKTYRLPGRLIPLLIYKQMPSELNGRGTPRCKRQWLPLSEEMIGCFSPILMMASCIGIS